MSAVMGMLFDLERKFGRWAIPNLIKYVVYGQAGFYVLRLANPEANLDHFMTLNWAAFASGDWWRIFTFVLIPPHMHPIFAIFYLIIMFMINDGMERAWGSFRINFFYLLCALSHVLIAWVFGGGVHPQFINLTLFIAFAVNYPDVQFLLFFILPVKVRWLAWLDGAIMTWVLIAGHAVERLMVLACFGVLAVFFGPELRRQMRAKALAAKNKADWELKQLPAQQMRDKACAECGRKDENAHPRLCTCEACGSEGRFWCEDHLPGHLERVKNAEEPDPLPKKKGRPNRKKK